MSDDYEDPEAPHGRDDQGVALAPYGYKVDGTPRKSRRGATAGQKGNASPTTAAKKPGGPPQLSPTDKARVQTLVGLGEMGIVMPMIGASMSPLLAKRIGPRHTEALAGDAVILQHFAEPLATAVVVIGQSKPGMLQWLDTVEEKAPYLMAVQVLVQLGKALAGNHMNPNPRLNNSGRLFAQIRAAQIADELEAQARAMGIPTEGPHIPEQREPDAEAA